MGRLGHAQEEYLGFTQAFKGIQAGYYWMECMSSKTKYTLNIKRNWEVVPEKILVINRKRKEKTEEDVIFDLGTEGWVGSEDVV